MDPEISECLTLARTELEVARQRIAREISGYPTPIAGCDAQFNHLLAQRQQVNRALDALSGDIHIPTPRNPG